MTSKGSKTNKSFFSPFVQFSSCFFPVPEKSGLRNYIYSCMILEENGGDRWEKRREEETNNTSPEARETLKFDKSDSVLRVSVSVRAQVCVGITYKSSFRQEPHGPFYSCTLFNYLNYLVQAYSHTPTAVFLALRGTSRRFAFSSLSLTLITGRRYVRGINHCQVSYCGQLYNFLWSGLYYTTPLLHND